MASLVAGVLVDSLVYVVFAAGCFECGGYAGGAGAGGDSLPYVGGGC